MKDKKNVINSYYKSCDENCGDLLNKYLFEQDYQ